MRDEKRGFRTRRAETPGTGHRQTTAPGEGKLLSSYILSHQPDIPPFRPMPRTRLISTALALCAFTPLAAQSSTPDWRSDWAVAQGFALRRDATGFRFPTAIVLVPHPGPRPDDPAYFVTELQGTIKVVTNDRSVHVFAKVPGPVPTRDTLPAQEGEVGLAGICLEPRLGYVFATYAYHDSSGVLRNAIARFQTAAGRFGLTPKRVTVFRKPFEKDVSAVSHQIGPCQTTGDDLFVSVGDGEDAKRSQDPGSTLGKILRLSYDGRPLPTNPYFRAAAPEATAGYVWARGLRNPFGLRLVGGQLLAADNGIAVDRFVEIDRGRNYLWDGTDHSIGAAAAQVLSPSPSPVQLDFCGGSGLPAEWRDRFYVALSGRPGESGPDFIRGGKGVLTLDYGLREHRMRSVPKYLLRYRGSQRQSVVGLACGPDGVYFVPIFPDATGESTVLVARYDPKTGHPYALFSDVQPLHFMQQTNCLGCHELGGQGGGIGPALDYDSLVPRLRTRLASARYREQVLAVDSLSSPPFANYRNERAQVLSDTGDKRLYSWIRFHIREPKFDNPNSLMPNLDVSDAEAVALTEFLLTPRPAKPKPPAPPPPKPVVKAAPKGRLARFVEALPLPRRAQLLLAFVGGLGVGVALTRAARRRVLKSRAPGAP